jgi:hypothetical protein
MSDRVFYGDTKIIGGDLRASTLGARTRNYMEHISYVNYGVFSAHTTSGSAGKYWHFKTNSLKGGSYADMVELRAYGKAYGNNTINNISWSWHCDGGGGHLYNVGYRNQSTSGGVTANNVYAASDGYIVCVAYVPNTYFTSLTFDSILSEMYTPYDFRITAWTMTSSNSGAY